MKRQRLFIQGLFIVIGLFCLVLGVFECLPNENCYSYEYSIYLKLKETTNVDDVRDQLQTMKLEYTLQDNKLTLTKYNNIVFDVLDNKTCKIAHNTAMQNFERMDSGSIIDMTFDGVLEYDGIQETITLKDNEITYVKKGNNYFIQTPSNTFVPGVLFIATAISFFIAYALCATPKKQCKAKLKTQPATGDANAATKK